MTRPPDTYKRMAREIAEGSIVTAALTRLLEQVIAEVVESQVKPMAAEVQRLTAENARLRTAHITQEPTP